jgi:glycosyltransferase involved in cell wall biosynthesis
MRRVAYVSPLPPDESGIADYSAELLVGLGKRFTVDLFTSEDGRQATAEAGLGVDAYAELRGKHLRWPYDAIVYQVGNNATYHGELYGLLQEIPGIAVLHEFMLHNLVRSGGSVDEFIDAMSYSYGDVGVLAAGRMLGLDPTVDLWSYPLFERVVDASCELIVHSATVRHRVLESRPGARVTVVPHYLSLNGLPKMNDVSRRALRRDLGVPDRALVLASFGNINRAKRIDVILRAFAQFRRKHPESVYLLAGTMSPDAVAIQQMLTGELGEGVIVTGHQSLPKLLALMDLTDIAINLRHPTGGETSGVCIRLLGLGKPVVVSADGWFLEIPDGCCAPIAPGVLEDEELLAVLDALTESEGLRLGMGAAAARWARAACSLEHAIDGYAEVIERVARERPARHVDPLPPLGKRSGERGFMREVAEAVADLSVPDGSKILLPTIAETLVELGLTGHR